MPNRNVADDASNPNKSTLANNDAFLMRDSESNPNSLKEIAYSVVKGVLDLLYAPIAKGVTNGDSHDHNGGDGAAIVEAAITLADNTTNNASTARHGFLKKLSNAATDFMNGQGDWTTPALPTGYLYSLTMSNNGTDPTNDIDIAAGKCRDSTDAVNMVLASALTGKQLDAAWAVGSGAGFLDQGSIANATYHIHLIKRSDTGVVDAIASLSHDEPAVVTMTIASPAVVTWGVAGRGHGLVAGSPFKFSTTGALPTGVTAGTQYYVIAAGLTETAFQFSTSNGGAAVNTSGTQSGVHTGLPGPKMPTGYDSFRRIFSILRESGAIVPVVQDGNTFMRKLPVSNVSANNPGTAAVTRTMSVPLGIRVQAILSVTGYGADAAGTPGAIYISDLSLNDAVAGVGGGNASVNCFTTAVGSLQVGGMVYVYTNKSGQVRSRCQISTANTSLYMGALGWVDTRGRL